MVAPLPGNVLPRTSADAASDQDFRALLRRLAAVEAATMTDLGSVSGAVTINFSEAPMCKITLGGNVTLTMMGYVEGRSYFLIVEQGAGAYTLTWPSSVKFPGGTDFVASTAAGAIDIVTMVALDLGTAALYAVGQKAFA